MTFTEAAAEVLRLVGKPLHYKDITDLAIQKNLLSHVGKSPEETMVARLTALLKKSPKENPLVRLKKDMFALRSWDEGKYPGFAEDSDLLPPYGPGPRKAAPPAPPAPRALIEADPRPADAARPDAPRAEREPAAARPEGRGDRRDRGRGRSRSPEMLPLQERDTVVAIEDTFAAAFSGAPAATGHGAEPGTRPAGARAQDLAEAIEAPVDPDKIVAGPLPREIAPVSGIEAHLLSSDDMPAAPAAALPSRVSDAAEAQDEVLREREDDEETTRLALSGIAPLRSLRSEPDDAASPEGASAEAPAATGVPAPVAGDGRRGRGGRDGRRGRQDEARGQGGQGGAAARPAAGAGGGQGRGKGRDEVAAVDEETRSAPAPDELLRANLAASATEVFAEEDDDDQPILGDEPASEPGAAGRRRRRRRRGGRVAEGGASAGGDGLPSYTVSPAFDGSPSDEARADERRPDEGRAAEGRAADERRPDEVRRGDERREGRDNREGRRGEERRTDERRAEAPTEERGAAVEGDEVVGRDMVELLLTALGGFDRSGGLVPVRNVAEALLRRGRVGGEVGQVTSMALAAARADNLRRQAEHKRPRFRLAGGRIGLTDWALNPELLRLEGEALAAMERYRDGARRILARKLGELPAAGFVEMVITVLERLGISQLRTVKRQGVSAGEVQLTGVQRGPGGETRLAVIIRKDAREIGRERVIEARGSLHHFAPATALWLVTSGQVLSGAREEALAPGAAAVALLDGVGLARLCEEHGLGVVRTDVSVSLPDLEFFEQMRGGN